MEIGLFAIAEYDDLMALWNRCGLPADLDGRDSRKSLERQIFDDHIVILTMKENGRMIGSVIGSYDGRKGWINRLAVDPDYRGRRLAARLVERAEEMLIQKGARVIGALIEDMNFPSMALFKYCEYEGWDHIVYFRKKVTSAGMSE